MIVSDEIKPRVEQDITLVAESKMRNILVTLQPSDIDKMRAGEVMVLPVSKYEQVVVHIGTAEDAKEITHALRQ